MPRPIPAKWSGICGRCGKPYPKGQEITYSTAEGATRRWFHYPECPDMPDAQVLSDAVKTVSTDQIAGVPRKLATRASQWPEIFTALLEAQARRILLCGPPGTGKSHTCYFIGTKEGKKTYRVTLTEGTGMEDIVGMYQLIDGATVWVDGPGTRALREGARLQFDEIDHAPQEINSLLYAFMDDNAQIMLPTGEQVNAAEGYTVVATTNGNISSLPEAIIDRVEAVLLAVTPHKDALEGLSRAEANAVQNHYRSIKTDPWNWSSKPTLRRMRTFSRLMKTGLIEDVVLAKAVFGNSGSEILSVLTTSGR